ncbi:MAG: hypothetical protein ABIT38_02360 [Gemmatimonadaceae bacterium]
MISGVPAIGMAQASKPAAAKMAHQKPAKKDMKDMQDMQGMRGMPGGPHLVLMMAYRDNLTSFTKALRSEVTRTDSVNPDVALPAVAEIKRSLEQMTQHHQAQMKIMGDAPKSPMAETMQHTTSHLATLAEHVTALDRAVNATHPNAKEVIAHTSEIMKECAGMMSMPAMGKPHSMK